MTESATDLVPPEQAPDGITLLTEDHRKVESIFQQLEQMPTGNDAARKTLVEQVTIALSRHAVAEEELLYPLIKRTVPGGEQMAEEAIAEHQEAKNTLQQLEDSRPGDPAFEDALRTLMADIRHHVQEEQSELFPALRQQISQADLDQLGKDLAKAEASAPTRPHPLSPNRPPFNKVAAPGAALLDKARDAVTGRGKD